jgi:hypothetical protein
MKMSNESERSSYVAGVAPTAYMDATTPMHPASGTIETRTRESTREAENNPEARSA